jgi:hypothetical protein
VTGEPFLITGLPRSRTAWMAAAAQNDKSVCLHEPLRHAKKWTDVFDIAWALKGFQYVGVSDHGMGFHLPEIMNRTAPRTLIIERPIAEVNASLARLGLPASNICDLLMEVLNTCRHPNILRVKYAHLESTEVVGHCLRHLMPDAVVCWERLFCLQRLNIQAQGIADVLAQGLEHGAQGAALLPPHILARMRLT